MRTWDLFTLRLPPGLREAAKAEAAKNKRSMNSEMLVHLERAFRGAEAATGAVSANSSPAAAHSHSDALQGAGQFHT